MTSTIDPNDIIHDALTLWRTYGDRTIRECLHDACCNAGWNPAPDDIEGLIGWKGQRTLYLMWSESAGWTRRFMLDNYRVALNAAGVHTVDLTQVPPPCQSVTFDPPNPDTPIHRVISFYDL